jgi:hypothetical protein
VDDDPSPLAAPRRAAINPGIYLSHMPGVPKLTDPPSGRNIGGQFIYWNVVYHDSHTNAGNLMGSWIGREGRGLQLWSTNWFSAQNTIRSRIPECRGFSRFRAVRQALEQFLECRQLCDSSRPGIEHFRTSRALDHATACLGKTVQCDRIVPAYVPPSFAHRKIATSRRQTPCLQWQAELGMLRLVKFRSREVVFARPCRAIPVIDGRFRRRVQSWAA